MDTEISTVEGLTASDIPGLEKLSQSLSEASAVEKCSICFENLQDTVLLWPCSHLFCKPCITSWRTSAKGGKIHCPLCKGSADRRSFLDFDVEQKKRADILQRLEGAISLDLGFDITTYRRSMGSGQHVTNTHKDKLSHYLSPLKKTVKKTFNKSVKIKTCDMSRSRAKKKSVTLRSGSTDNIKIPLPVANDTTEALKDDNKDKKVKEWLDATKFSQVGEEHLQEIVVDVHVPDLELTALSEEQLKSVTQMDCETPKTTFKHKPKIKSCQPSFDLDDIRPFDEIEESNLNTDIQQQTKKVTKSIPDEFDDLLPLKKKGQLIQSTYRGKIPLSSNCKKNRIFTIESDIFKSDVVNQKTESDIGKFLDPSHDILEDPLSGNDEEWSAGSKKKEQTLRTENIDKNVKNNIYESIERKVTRKSARLAKRSNPKSMDESQRKLSKFAQINHSESKSAGSSIAKLMEAAFKNNNCQKSVDKVTEVYGNDRVVHPTEKVKERQKIVRSFDPAPIQRSPGWSRLTTTKKEFHMSEKKKLSLKTLNSSISHSVSDIAPLSVDQNRIESSKQDPNQCVTSKSPRLLKENIPIEKEKEEPSFNDLDVDFNQRFAASTPKLEQVLNQSFTSFTSFFKGFSTPKSSKDSKGLHNFDEESNKLCNVEIPKKVNSADKNSCTELELNETEIPSNKNSNSGKYQNPFNVSETNLKTNMLDCKVSSNMPFLQKDEEKQSRRNVSEDVELNHLPFPNSINESTFINSRTNEEHGVVNLHTVSSDQREKCKPCINNGDKKKSSPCSQEGIEETQHVSNKVRNLNEDNKRRREPSVESHSSPHGSPLRKRFCRDVQIQTSPSKTESLVEEYIKNVYGVEKNKLLELASTNNKDIAGNQEQLSKVVNNCNVVQCDFSAENPYCKINLFQAKSSTKGNEEYLSQLVNESDTNQGHVPHESIYCKPILIEDCDKENSGLGLAYNMSEKFLNDSDIVVGTEDCARHNLNHKFKCPNMQTILNSSVLEDSEVKEENEIDPNAVTQPYKTPVGPKQTIPTQTYSALSNPTNSELKKVNDVFLKDELFLNDTSKNLHSSGPNTPWNSSGIKELENYTIKENKHEDLICMSNQSENSKEKNRRSRRQLDFIEEDSQSNDMFDAVGNELVFKNIESKEHNLFVKTNASDSEEDDILVVYDKLSQSENPTTKQSCGNVSISKCSVISNSPQTVLTNNTSKHKLQDLNKNKELTIHSVQNTKTLTENIVVDDDQVSNSSSVDSFIVGTPDTSQVEMSSIKIQSKEEPEKLTSLTEFVESTDNQACCEKEETLLFLENDKQNSPAQNTEQSNTILDEDLVETEETDMENYCFASSLLNSQQNRDLQLVLKSFNIPFSRTVSADISHLVVGTTERRTQNTYKFLHAMALHKTIISFDWVEEVMVKKAGQTVALDPYFALDASGECGVLRAKQDKKRTLLQEFAILIYNVTPHLVTKEQMEELVRLCGGMVVSKMSDFLTVPRDKFRIIVFSEPPDNLNQTDWRHKYNAVEVFTDWIYNTIGRYRVVPLQPFLLDQTDAVPFLRHQGYPEDLIFDSPTQQ